MELSLRHAYSSLEGKEELAGHGLRDHARSLIAARHGYSVAVRARSRTPAVEPTYMSSVMR